MNKAPDAFRTISEVADDLAIPQHVLRFWESRFPQVRPMKRGGGRRYYRPDDVDLLRGIRHLLYGEGYTIRGVQRILREQGIRFVQAVWQTGAPQPDRSVAADDTADEMSDAELDAEEFAAERGDLDAPDAADEPDAPDQEDPPGESPAEPRRVTPASTREPAAPLLSVLRDRDRTPVRREPTFGSTPAAAATTPAAGTPGPSPSAPPPPGLAPQARERLAAVLADLEGCQHLLAAARTDTTDDRAG